MKKVGDLMAELGFRPEGSESVKRAFIENLVRAAAAPAKKERKEEQLSFDLALEPEVPFPSGRKRPTG